MKCCQRERRMAKRASRAIERSPQGIATGLPRPRETRTVLRRERAVRLGGVGAFAACLACALYALSDAGLFRWSRRTEVVWLLGGLAIASWLGALLARVLEKPRRIEVTEEPRGDEIDEILR